MSGFSAKTFFFNCVCGSSFLYENVYDLFFFVSLLLLYFYFFVPRDLTRRAYAIFDHHCLIVVVEKKKKKSREKIWDRWLYNTIRIYTDVHIFRLSWWRLKWLLGLHVKNSWKIVVSRFCMRFFNFSRSQAYRKLSHFTHRCGRFFRHKWTHIYFKQ